MEKTESAGSKVAEAKGTPSLFAEKEASLRFSLYFLAAGLILKIFTTAAGGSLTQVADLFRSFTEVLAVLFSYWSIRKIALGQDELHHFGYGKLESLATLSIAGVILASCLVILIEMVLRLENPPVVGNIVYGFVLAALSAGTDFYFWRRNYRISKKEKSPVMESQWRLFRTKLVVNLCVFTTLGISMAFRSSPFVLYIDILGSAVVAAFMLLTAKRLLSSSVHELVDGALDESLQIIILRELAGFFSEYEQFHGWRCRRSGSEVYIDIFLEFEPARTMGDVQEVTDRMKNRIEDEITNSHVFIIPTTKPVK